MSSAEWFRWAAAFLLGARSTVAIEFGRGQFERRQRQRDPRDDFQRETPIGLQGAIHGYVDAMTFAVAAARQKAVGEPVTALRGFENWSATARTDGARVTLLPSRLDNPELRQTAQRFGRSPAPVAASAGASADAAHAARIKVQAAEKDAVDHRGELLRKL